MDERRRRRSGGAFAANIQGSDRSTIRTFLTTCKNRALAVGTLKGCCGHPGEPGC
jgi:hypothetical protein